MVIIPKNHPRVKSLLVRERLVKGFDEGIVAKEGLLAHGRGEAFDYLLGEKTSKKAKNAICASAALLTLAKRPVISVNGNSAALCPKETVDLSKVLKAKIEVNLFYANEKRKQNIIRFLKKNGAKQVLGGNKSSQKILSNLTSARRVVDKGGIFAGDVILVPLEDGDRTLALKKMRKKVITFDLNPLSRTAQTADITIVDNVIRGMKELNKTCKKFSKKNRNELQSIVRKFDNKKNLASSILAIKNYLNRRARHA